MKNFVFVSPHFPDSYWKFCLALKNRGFNVLGIGDAPYYEIPEQCKIALTEYYCCSKMENIENERAALEYFEKKYGHIDYLESNNEYWLEKDAQLRKEFNITTGAWPEEVKYYKHKSLQKEMYAKAGVKAARFTTDTSKEGLLKFVNEVGYPIFIKPDNGVGGQGTFKVSNETDLENFLKEKETDVTYIVEEYVNGQIISYDGVCNSQSEVLFSTSNVFLPSMADIVNGNLDDMYYCVPEIDPVLDEIGRRVIKAFGLKNRFFHIEFFKLFEDHPYLGKAGTYVPLEGNMRPAGGYTPDLINYANSISCYDVFADSLAYDESRQVAYNKKYYAITSSRRFALKYVHTIDEVIAKYRENITMSGEYPDALKDAMGDTYFFARFNTYEEAMEFDDFVRSKLK